MDPEKLEVEEGEAAGERGVKADGDADDDDSSR